LSINISELIWTVICFFVLLVVLKKLLFDPLVSFMAARDARIQDGLNAGRTAQRLHAQAGVIGDGGQAACLADGFSLDEGVLGKGGAGLLRLDGDAQLLLADHLVALRFQNAAQFAELSGVAGSCTNFHLNTPSAFKARPFGRAPSPRRCKRTER